VDRAAFPRDKICGDAFSGKVVNILNALELDLTGRDSQLPSWGVTFFAPNGKALRVPFRKDIDKSSPAPGFIAKRMDFDDLLVRRMGESHHVDFRQGAELRRFERIGNHWMCYDKQGRLQARAKCIVAADGAQSAFARTVGGIRQDPKHFAAGIRAYYRGVSGMDEENFIELHFLEEFVPGYLWIFPLPGGLANVGIGLRSDLIKKKRLDLKQTLFDLIERHPALQQRFSGAQLVDEVRGFGLPLGSVKRRISGPGYLLVGDAASLIDPFTGEGIGNAMISGRAAADALQAWIDRGDDHFNKYDEDVYRQLWKELKLSHRLQQLAQKKWLFNALINKAVRSEALSDMISSMFMDLDVRDHLKRPSFYVKLFFK
jgi:geranylgeranyl reductase family protein